MDNYYRHPTALVESKLIGKNTRIWDFVHILPDAIIGEECNICSLSFIENEVIIGNRVTVKNGVFIFDGIIIEDDVFIGPNTNFTNDPFPRSKQHLCEYPKTYIRKGASIGANATILPGIVIGKYAMVGAGSVVTKDVPPYAIVAGNPARIKGYVQENKRKVHLADLEQFEENTAEINIKGVKLLKLPIVEDLRGGLTFAEVCGMLPFIPRRYFLVFNVPGKDIRGEHAHKECHQYLTCVKGECSVVVDNGEYRVEVLLNKPNLGLYIPPLIWATQYKYSEDAVLLVLASEVYEAEDYIRDYDDFLEEIKK